MGYGQPPPQQQMPPQQQQQQQQQPQPQQMPPQQQAYAQQQQPPMTDASYAPAGVPKKGSTGLIIGIIVGLFALVGVVAAVLVVGMGPKTPTVPSASVSSNPVAVPTIPPSSTAEPETTADTPPPAVEEAGAAAAVEVDAGVQAVNTTPDPNNGGQPVANPNNGGGTWTPPPPGPTPVAAVKDAGAAPAADPNAFNEGTARSRLGQANGVLVFCKKEGGVTGPGTATVTFSPDGSVASVAMDAPYAGTPTGDCVAGQFKRQKTNAWQGSPQSVKHSFEVPK